nr:glycoside hydrolase family 2 [Actinomycetales bacterium]
MWQTVWLESVPETAVEGLVVTPDLAAGVLEVEVTTTAPTTVQVHLLPSWSPEGSGEAVVTASGVSVAGPRGEPVPTTAGHPTAGEAGAGGPVAGPSGRGVAGGNARAASSDPVAGDGSGWARTTLRLPIPDVRPWSPEDPHLYGLRVHAGADQVASYAAMRSVELASGEHGRPVLLLNGAPYFHAGVLDQGYWPESLVTPPSDASMEWDIAAMKDLGYTMLRKHIKIEPLRWYFHADRLGMLVWQDFVNGGRRYNRAVVQVPAVMTARIDDSSHALFGRQDEAGREDYWREAAETVALLRNSPSIVCWVPFNEGWGQFDAVRVAEAVRGWDPSRLIDHASGWHDQGAGDFLSPHIYFREVRPRPEWGADGRAVVLSEYGGYSHAIPGHEFSRREFGYRRFGSPGELTAAWERLHREQVVPAVDGGLAGFVYTQLSDVEDEMNGLVTADRTVVKVEAEVQRAVNAAVRAEFERVTGG